MAVRNLTGALLRRLSVCHVLLLNGLLNLEFVCVAIKVTLSAFRNLLSIHAAPQQKVTRQIPVVKRRSIPAR